MVDSNSDSQFGELNELNEAYTVKHPPISTIFDVTFKMELGTFTSIEGVVTHLSIDSSRTILSEKGFEPPEE